MQVQVTITFESADLKSVNKNLTKVLRDKEVLAQIVAICSQMGIDIDVKPTKTTRANGVPTGTTRHADHPPQARRARR